MMKRKSREASDFVAKQRAARGIDTPDPKNDSPDLFPNVLWIWDGFTRLNRSRGAGMNGPLPFAIADIEACLNLLGIRQQEDREEFFAHAIALDDAFLAHWYAEDAKKKKKEQSAQRAKGARK